MGPLFSHRNARPLSHFDAGSISPLPYMSRLVQTCPVCRLPEVRRSGTPITDRPPGGRGRSPAPRLPQNVACRFPALRSSEVASQLGDSLQLRVREIQLWSQQRKPLLDPMELLPPDLPLPTTAAQHFAPITFHGRWTRCSARMFPAMPQYAFQETELHELSRHNPAQIRTCGAGSVERN